MKDVLETIIKNLVSKPNEVEIAEKNEEKSTVFEVRVANEDMGKVIGREGKIAKAIRGIIRAVAIKEGKKVTVEFID